jgi:membrane fusion protein (multidrug efflux system)
MSDDTQPQAAPDQPEASGEGKENEANDNKAKDTTPIYRRPFFWVLILVAGVAVVGGTLYYLHSRQFEATDDAFVDAHIVRIAPEVAGTLIDVADLDNRHVNAGQLLAVIKPAGPEAQLDEARAGVDQALAQLQQAQAQISSAIATRNQAAAEAQAPLTAAVKAAQDLARYQNLAKIDRSAVASTQLDQAHANANSTRAQADAAQRQIASADAQIAVARRQADAASAVIAAKRAQVAQANVTLGNLRLVAPVSGQVVNRQVNKGSYVAPGSQLLAIVPDTMWVTANFKETQLKNMRIGQPVAIKVDAYPDVEFKGRVDSIQRGAGQAFAILPPQNATGNYVKVVQRVPVRINFITGNGNPDPRNYPIGPGMSVTPSVKVR